MKQVTITWHMVVTALSILPTILMGAMEWQSIRDDVASLHAEIAAQSKAFEIALNNEASERKEGNASVQSQIDTFLTALVGKQRK